VVSTSDTLAMRLFSLLLLSCSIAAKNSGRWSTEEQKKELREKIKKHHQHKEQIKPCIQELYRLKKSESLQRAKRSWVQLCHWNKGFFDDCETKQGVKQRVCENRGPHAFELVDKLKNLDDSQCLSLLSNDGICDRKRRPGKQKNETPDEDEGQQESENQTQSEGARSGNRNPGQHGPGRLGRFGLNRG